MASPPIIDLNARTKRRSKKTILLAPVKMTHAQELTLYSIYLRVLKLWEEAAQRIASAYGSSLDNDGPSNGPGDAAREIDATAVQAQTLMILLPTILATWASRAEKVHQVKWVRAVMAATKVDIGPMLAPSDMTAILKASADWNAALVKDVSGQIQRQISNIVFSGFQSKTSVYEVAKEINKTTGIARRRARNVAYDQINKLGAALNRARREQAGIDSYMWQHSAKLHARPTHLARNGMIFKNNDPRIPKGDRCSEPPFCGCHERAVIPARQEVVA
jgi:SPP1 gp7 family putative phage head morphogenesis protein